MLHYDSIMVWSIQDVDYLEMHKSWINFNSNYRFYSFVFSKFKKDPFKLILLAGVSLLTGNIYIGYTLSLIIP